MAKRLIPLLLACGLLMGWHWFEPAARRNQKGIEAFRQGKFAAALEHFLSAKGLKAGAPQLKNNTAAALYQLKKYQEALDEFSSIDPAALGSSAAGLHYNLGNASYRLERYAQALESYKHALLLDPDDVPAKKNYELTLKKMREQQQQPQQQEQQDDRAEAEKQKQKYEAMMQFLNQNEKQQMEKRKRRISAAKNEKDW
ncbi:MAG: tetratricopeptide repeat protein [Acidobacteria bacterium]|jgi:tetratricopeptide (TPR) repeat protein|nr:tetratricopeptide repeat protein [Acidobacteriota bacterium]